jgi:uncharacterized protein (TIGR04222 family)
MTVVAASGDTWGISGPRFLQIYALLGVTALVIALIWRALATRGTDPGGYQPPGPVELAYLAGGPRLAAQAALAGLRCAGVVGPGPTTRTVAAIAAAPAGAGEVERALHAAAATPLSIASLSSDPRVRYALDRTADGLVDAGLLLSSGHRRVARLGALFVLAALAFGVVRIAAGAANHKAVGFLVFASIIVLVVGLRLLAVPTTSRAGRRLLRRARSVNSYLRPNLSPSWATYGASGAMLGVALFGTSAWWAADPAFATHAGIAAATSSGYSGNSGGGSSCSSSSSCSSGSSCGGGGGCGGGGCGG